MTFAPILIVGVPRSGTTLLRVFLDSHSRILALPETPWLSGVYGSEASLRELVEGLVTGPFGVVRNVAGVTPEHVRLAGKTFLERLFQPVLAARGKTILAFKTPSDIRNLDFLTEFLPEARYIHITRDGRDVAMSQLAKKGSFFHDLGEYRGLSFANAFKRWAEWEQRIRDTLYRGGLKIVHVRYEDLIASPERELKRILAFLDLPFEPGMLDYASQEHDYPAWEAGSTDVAGRGGISTASLGRWRGAKMSVEMLYTLNRYDQFLVDLGYPPSQLKPGLRARAAMFLFPFFKPAVDEVSHLYSGWLRPVLRNRSRIAACLALLALAVQFLVPTEITDKFGLTTDAYQPLLCFVASLYLALTAIPSLARRWGNRQILLRLGATMLTSVAVLELSQGLVPSRHASLKDFSFNALGVIAALAVSRVLLFRASDGTGPA